MNNENALDLNIVCDSDFVAAFKEECVSRKQIKIKSEKPHTQASELFMDVIGIVSLAVSIYGITFGPIGPMIYNALKKSKSKSVVIRTALGTLELHLDEDVDEKDFYLKLAEVLGQERGNQSD